MQRPGIYGDDRALLIDAMRFGDGPIRAEVWCGRGPCSDGARAEVKVSTARSINVVAAVAVAVLTFAYRFLSFERFPNDHFVVLSRAQQVLMGALPVRDYLEYQAPLAVMASAWAQVAFGPGLHAELLLVCGAFAVAAAMAYLVTASISESAVVGIACALILTAATPVTYAYPKVLPYALAFGAAWLYAQKPGLGRLWLLAATVVFGGLLRHDHAIVLGTGATVAVSVAHSDRRALTAVAHLAVAGFILTAPYIVWVQRYEGLGNYIAANIDTARTEGRATAWSPVSLDIDDSRPRWITLADPQEPIVYVRWRPDLSEETRHRFETEHRLRLVGDIEQDAGKYDASRADSRALADLTRDPAVRETAGIDLRTGELVDRRPWSAHVLQYVVLPGDGLRPVFVGLLYYALWVLPIVAACFVAARWTRLPLHVRSIAAMAITIELVMCAEMLRAPLPTRVRDLAAPLVLVLASMSAVTRTFSASTSARSAVRGALGAVFLAVGVAVAGAGSFGPNLRETGVSRGWQGVTARIAEIRARYVVPYERIGFTPGGMIEYVMTCTAPQSRMLAIAVVQQLFFYTDRGFAGGSDGLFGFYRSDRQATQILQRLSREDVPLVVLDSAFASSMMQTYPRIAAYVMQHYHEIGRFAVSEGQPYIMLAENGRMAVRSFGDLPCFAPPERRRSQPFVSARPTD